MDGAEERGREARGGCGRFALIGCAGVLFLLFAAAMVGAILLDAPTPAVAMVSAIAAAVPALVYALLVIVLDRYEREPKRVLLGTFLWGAIVATFVSLVLNSLFSLVVGAQFGEPTAEVLGPALSAPVVEEVAKGAALLLLLRFMRREFDNVLDGIVYGALVGIGFAMTENVLYFERAFESAEEAGGSGYAGLALTFYLRAVLGGLGHAAYTATTGAALGYARETHSTLRRIEIPLLGLFLAIVQHFAWNHLAGLVLEAVRPTNPLVQLFVFQPLVRVIFIGPALAVLGLLVVLAWRREAKIICDELRPEVEAGLIRPEEYARLSSTRARLAAEWRALLRGGPGLWRATSRFHQMASDLALAKWHLAREAAPAELSAEVRRLRWRIEQLRARLGEPEPERDRARQRVARLEGGVPPPPPRRGPLGKVMDWVG